MIRNIRIGDARQICDIYNHYIATSVITFEEEPIDVPEMEKRIADVTSRLPWFVHEEEGRISGYAYASPWKARSAYRFTAESTVYVRHGALGIGIGTQLYGSLLDALAGTEIHAVVAGIALPNEHSRRLHEKFGFKKAAHFPEVGYKFNRWIDVGYWEKILQG